MQLLSIYIIILSLLLINNVVATDKRSTISYKVLWVVLTVFLALRFGQGSDWGSYSYIYLAAPTSLDFGDVFYGDSYHTEFGWKLLMNVFKIMKLKFTSVSLLLALVDMMLVDRFIEKYSNNGPLSLLILYPTYYLTYFFSGLREGLVIAIFLGIMIDLAIQRRWVFYYLCCFICATIHTSALILALLPLVIRIQRKTYSILILISVLMGVFGELWVGRLPVHLTASYINNSTISVTALLYRFVLITLLLLIVGEGKGEESEINAILIKSYLFSLVLYLLLIRYPLIASRLSAILGSVEIALLPNLLVRGNQKVQYVYRCVLITLIVIMTIKNINSYITQGKYHTEYQWYNYPYVTVFDREKLYGVCDNPYNIFTYDA